MPMELATDFVTAVLEKFAEPIAESTSSFAKTNWEKFKIDSNKVFQYYLDNAYDKHSKVKTILYRSDPVPLRSFFEHPTLEYAIAGNEYYNYNEFRARKSRKNGKLFFDSSNIDGILKKSNFIIVTGDGGIGKSTFMKHLFISEYSKKELIPIFLELRDLNDIEGNYEVSEFIFRKLYNLGAELKQEYMEYALQSGCFIFLLDGYDEIVSSKKRIFIKKFTEFCDRYAKNRYILSSRPDEEIHSLSRFTVLKICPFEKEQALRLIQKLKFDENIKKQFYNALNERLFDSHRTFASNPLLLTVMLLTYDQYAEIPQKMHQFYADAFDTLFRKHNAVQGVYRREFRSNLPIDSFKRILARFCFITYYKGKLEFTQTELTKYFEKIKTTEKNRIHGFEFDIPSVIHDLENNLCILCKDGLNYKFTHKSFQEYFTTVHLEKLAKNEDLTTTTISLIERDFSRVINDTIFDMLLDMAQEKVEQNIFLPLLEKIEETCDTDKYLFYLKIALKHNAFSFYINRQTKILYYNIRYDNANKYFLFIWSKTLCIFDYKKDAQCSNLLRFLDNDRDSSDLSTDVYIDASFFNHREFFNYFSKTWVGQHLTKIANLKENLEKKESESDSELDELLMMP